MKEEKIWSNKVVIEVLRNREYKTEQEIAQRDIYIKKLEDEVKTWTEERDEFIKVAG